MVQNEEGKIDETKLTNVLENYKGLETKNKEMSEKITAFDSQKDEIIKQAKSSAIKIQEGGTLDFSSLVSDATSGDSFKEVIKASGVSQGVVDTIIPTLNKFEQEAKELLESSETKSRIQQAKDLELGINEKTVAFLSKDDYSAIVKLANRGKGPGNAGDASQIAAPLDRVSAERKLDNLTQKSTKTLKEWEEVARLKEILDN